MVSVLIVASSGGLMWILNNYFLRSVAKHSTAQRSPAQPSKGWRTHQMIAFRGLILVGFYGAKRSRSKAEHSQAKRSPAQRSQAKSGNPTRSGIGNSVFSSVIPPLQTHLLRQAVVSSAKLPRYAKEKASEIKAIRYYRLP